METDISFGLWVEKRRKALDLTRAELAQNTGCSSSTLRKIESNERRPSKQLAELLANALDIAADDRPTFIRIARGESSIDRLKSSPPLSTLSRLPSSQTFAKPIPIPPTPLIGRETELAALRQMLSDSQCRLITLAGPGGSGKTRLAIEVAHEQNGGAVFVPLASVNAASLMIPVIADELGFIFYGVTDPKVQLLNYLREKHLLLVLDNMEHLLDGADLVTEILQSAPRVKILCTSREPFNLRGEWIFEVGGLGFSTGEDTGQTGNYDAQSLFVHCAQRTDVKFVLTSEEASDVTRICALLEGMPLAIELAAAWTRTLSCHEIVQEIERGLDILVASARDVPERHHSMQTVFDHSWNLLTEEECRALARLSVFRGGFTREAAKEVAGASLTVLSSLISKSLLRHAGTGRYDLHELIRQYLVVRLMTNAEIYEETKECHFAFYLALAESADSQLRGSGQLKWLSRLEMEHDNLRAALEWPLVDEHPHPSEYLSMGLRMAGTLRWFWQIRGYFQEGCTWLEKALHGNRSESQMDPLVSPSDLLENEQDLQYQQAKACALEGLALLTNSLGNHNSAHTLAEQSIAIYQRLGNKLGLADALMILGQTLRWQGQVTLGHSRLKEALTLYREEGDHWNTARCLYRLGTYLADFGADVAGQTMLEESSSILEQLGDKYLFVNVLVSRGIVAQNSCDYPFAKTLFNRSLTIAQEIRDPWEMADALTNIGCILRIQGDYTTASGYFEEALRIYKNAGCGLWCTDPLCALTENDIAQNHLADAHLHIQEASSFAEASANTWIQILVGYFHGLLAYYEGDMERSTTWLKRVITLARESQYKPDLARSLITLGRVMQTRNETARVTALLAEGLELFWDSGNSLGIATALEAFAEHLISERAGRAALLFGIAEAIRDKIGAPLPPIDRPAYERNFTSIRAQLGEPAFVEIWAKGRAIDWEQAIAIALEDDTERQRRTQRDLRTIIENSSFV